MSEVHASPLAATTFVVVDLETTGVVQGLDKIVELAVVVVSAKDDPVVVLNTLVQPGREMGATDIHGLTNADVAGAPWMVDLGDALEALVANRVVAAHNSKYDVGFLEAALGDSNPNFKVPHVCTMGMHTLLGLGTHFALRSACFNLGVEIEGKEHTAVTDALATARLLQGLVRHFAVRGVTTFGELAQLAGDRTFARSLGRSFVPAPTVLMSDRAIRQKPRQGSPPEKANRLREYLNLVLQVVSDLCVSEAEVEAVTTRRHELRIEEQEMRAIHARVLASMITRYAEDRRIDEHERAHLRRLHECLDALGWAPGT